MLAYFCTLAIRAIFLALDGIHLERCLLRQGNA